MQSPVDALNAQDRHAFPAPTLLPVSLTSTNANYESARKSQENVPGAFRSASLRKARLDVGVRASAEHRLEDRDLRPDNVHLTD